MIYKATRLIARAMDAEEIKYSVHEQENYSEVSAMSVSYTNLTLPTIRLV